MSHYKSYQEYKNSGIEWLGDIPKHWDIYDFWIISKVKSLTSDKPETLLSVYLDRGVIPHSEGGGLVHKPSDSLEKYQLVEEGDFVMNNQQAWRGSVGVSNYRGLVSPAYLVFSLNKNLVNQDFAKYLLRDKVYVEQFMLCSLSVGTIQRQIKWPHLRKMKVALPPLPEQMDIFSSLEREVKRIDTLIKKKNRFIDLLHERRKSLITQAVTKGLDPNIETKDSGVIAIGKVPSHWKIKPLRAEMSIKKDSVGEQWEKFSLLSLTRKGVIPRDTSENFGKFPESFETYQKVEKNDLVMCLFDIDETPRTVGLSNINGMITGAYSIFSIKNDIYRKYLYYTFIHLDDEKGMKPYYSGLRKTIRPSKFLGIHFPFPPEDEAKAICNHIDKGTGRIDNLITKTQRSIDLLKEHRAALITATVTGKIDLRGENGKEAA